MKIQIVRAFVLLIFSLASSMVSSLAAANDTNVRFAPLGFFLGPMLEVDFKLTDNWTLGPSLGSQSISFLGTTYEITTVGARANYHFDKSMEDSFYLSLAANYTVMKLGRDELQGELSGAVIRALAGYMWAWTNFNIMLGGGVENSSVGTKATLEDSQGNEEDITVERTGSYFMLDFSLGWAW